MEWMAPSLYRAQASGRAASVAPSESVIEGGAIHPHFPEAALQVAVHVVRLDMQAAETRSGDAFAHRAQRSFEKFRAAELAAQVIQVENAEDQRAIQPPVVGLAEIVLDAVIDRPQAVLLGMGLGEQNSGLFGRAGRVNRAPSRGWPT